MLMGQQRLVDLAVVDVGYQTLMVEVMLVPLAIHRQHLHPKVTVVAMERHLLEG